MSKSSKYARMLVHFPVIALHWPHKYIHFAYISLRFCCCYYSSYSYYLCSIAILCHDRKSVPVSLFSIPILSLYSCTVLSSKNIFKVSILPVPVHSIRRYINKHAIQTACRYFMCARARAFALLYSCT